MLTKLEADLQAKDIEDLRARQTALAPPPPHRARVGASAL